jgi:hypothetical protein
MHPRRFTLALVSVQLGFAVSGATLADRGHFGGGHFHHFHAHSRFSVFVDAPLFWPWYYPAPYYYYPPVVTPIVKAQGVARPGPGNTIDATNREIEIEG